MKKLLLLAVLAALPSCATRPPYVDCSTAAQVREAAAATITLIDSACPIPAE